MCWPLWESEPGRDSAARPDPHRGVLPDAQPRGQGGDQGRWPCAGRQSGQSEHDLRFQGAAVGPPKDGAEPTAATGRWCSVQQPPQLPILALEQLEQLEPLLLLGPPLRGVFLGVVSHHPDRPLPHFRGKPARSWHNSNPLKEWKLRQSRGDSVRRLNHSTELLPSSGLPCSKAERKLLGRYWGTKAREAAEIGGPVTFRRLCEG